MEDLETVQDCCGLRTVCIAIGAILATWGLFKIIRAIQVWHLQI